MRRVGLTVVTVLAAMCAGLPVLAGAPSAWAQVQRSTRAAGSGGTWGTAEEFPGTAALNTGGQATLNAVSCTSAGTCGAGGHYSITGGPAVGFVGSQSSGTWGTAQGIGSNLSYSWVRQMSCVSAGNCSAAGQFQNDYHYTEIFAASERNGRWGTAKLLPGIEALNGGGYAEVTGLSCAAPGTCSAVGAAFPSSGTPNGWVADEKGGTWSKAEGVPGLAAMRSGPYGAGTEAVSCPSAGNCSAGGNYYNGTGVQAFVVDQVNGTWGTAQELPGSAALNQGGYGEIDSVSCASAGNCMAGGYYDDSSHDLQAMVASEKNGTWGRAKKVPGFAALNAGGPGQINSLSCASAGSCAAAGYYTDSSGDEQAFVVSSTGGVWGTAEELPGTATLNAGGQAQLSSVSCGAAGSCAAGGYYNGSGPDNEQVFVASSVGGVWGTAEEIPGTASLNAGGLAQLSSVSCGATGSCAAGGYYTDSAGQEQAFIVDETG
jgi:hypothetical protein